MLVFKYGSMSSGKSLELLRIAYDNEKIDKKVLIMKPRTDTRSMLRGECIISSRIGVEKEGVWIPDNIVDFLDLVYDANPDIVLIDECQFLFEDIVSALRILADDDIDIICFGLLLDFQREMFPATKKIIEFADDIEYIQGLCECCGKPATAVVRLDVEGEPVFVGEKIEVGFNYISVCHKCYAELEEKKMEDMIDAGRVK